MARFQLRSMWVFLLFVLLLCSACGGSTGSQSSSSPLSRFKLLGPFQFSDLRGHFSGGGAGSYADRDLSPQEIKQFITADFASTLFYHDGSGRLQVVDGQGRRPTVSVSAPDSSSNSSVSYIYNTLTETINFVGTITPDNQMKNAYYQYSYSYGTTVNGGSISTSKNYSAYFESPMTAA
jgi:hypothetical protein